MDKLENVKWFIVEHKYVTIVLIVIVIILLGIGGYFLYQVTEDSKSHSQQSLSLADVTSNKVETDNVEKEESCELMVDIKGEIYHPGLYKLACDSRILDVINLAGGSTENADTSVLNLSKKIEDEMVIIVYSKDQVANFITTKEKEKEVEIACLNQSNMTNGACFTEEDLADANNQSNTSEIGDTPVNNSISLNTATKEELMQLPGIGESKAELIIRYREENGSFQNIEEIKNIKGIGDSIFEKIKANITL